MVLCDNVHCKYNRKKDGGKNKGKSYCILKGDLALANGACKSFERSITWYFNKVWNALENTNMIPFIDLTEELKIGLYYVMQCYDLGFVQQNYGSWEWFSLVDHKDKSKKMTYQEIIKRPLNFEKFAKFLEDYNNGIIAGSQAWREQENMPEPVTPKKSSQPYGLLAPNGNFIEGEFGEHEEMAWNILNENNWVENYYEESIGTACDYLVNNKYYAIIHCPTGDGGYIVTTCPWHPLSKKQKDFLYNYFYDMGNVMRAECYLDAE